MIVIDNNEKKTKFIYKFSGKWLNENNGNTQEINTKIKVTQAVYAKMQKMLCNENMSMKLKIGMLRCYIFSAFLYGPKHGQLRNTMSKRSF